MSEFSRAARNLVDSVGGDGDPGVSDATRDFIEKVTFAEAGDILEVLHELLTEDWMAMPVWARNLAYRLVCLQRPDDPDLLREAAVDLYSFGPDWDGISEALEARAAQVESDL